MRPSSATNTRFYPDVLDIDSTWTPSTREGGRMIIQLSRKNTSDETWDYLSDLASEFDSDKLELTLVN